MTSGAGGVGGPSEVKVVALEAGLAATVGAPPVETVEAPLDSFTLVTSTAAEAVRDAKPDVLIKGILTFLGLQHPAVVDLVSVLYKTSMWSGFLSGEAFDISPVPEGEAATKFSGWLGQLGRFVDGALQTAGKSPRYVVYPAAGVDSASVTAAFPKADGYVLLSQNSFIRLNKDGAPVIDPMVFDVGGAALEFEFNAVKQTGRVSGETDRAGGTLPMLIANLKMANPSMELVGVLYFIATPMPSYVGNPDYSSKTHGIIFYKPTPESEMKMMVYLQEFLSESSKPAIAVTDLYEATPVGVPVEFMDALFVKGSQGAVCPIRSMPAERAVYATPEELVKQHAGRDLMLEKLQQSSGVIVAGVHAHHAFSERGYAAECCEVFPEEVYRVPSYTPDKGWAVVAQDPKFTLSYLPGIKLWGYNGEEASRTVPSVPTDILGVDAMLGAGKTVDAAAALGSLFTTNVLGAKPAKPVSIELDPRIDKARTSMDALRERVERATRK